MQQFRFTWWHHSPESEGAARFSLSSPEKIGMLPSEKGADPLESLRFDVIIALSNHLTAVSIAHPHLASFLMDGLDNALERLQAVGHEGDLRRIQQWLLHERDENFAV